MRKFHSCKHEEGQSVSSYVLKMKSYIDNLERLGHPVSLGLGVSLILISLHKEFDSFVQNYNMHSMGKIINELHAMLKLHEQTLPKNNAPALYAIRAGKGKNKLAYAPKPKIFPPPKREDPAKDLVCHQCGDTGIFTIELYTFPNKSWVYDTGCGTYICNITHGLRGSRKMKPDALSLYVGNEGLSQFPVCTMMVMLTVSWIIQFKFLPRDGIFEINLSDSYTNVSSMYALSNKRAKSNLDSALLWHCRLGYISKKRIEKLQHDGLLNSTDLKDFEKCVPEDTYPSIDTSLHHEEDDLEIDEPRRDLGEPAYYKAVLLDPESDKWLNAMNWLFKKKTDMDGAVHTYKACLVAKGYTQTLRIDYEETFSPVAEIRAIRILIAIAAFYDYEIWQIDVKTAFLNGYLSKEVYMEQLEGFVNPKYPNRDDKLANKATNMAKGAKDKVVGTMERAKKTVQGYVEMVKPSEENRDKEVDQTDIDVERRPLDEKKYP
ncbi:zinc finger, CCHC-type containing protein [Tanacetum coccineum]